jgi:hypothetical protein
MSDMLQLVATVAKVFSISRKFVISQRQAEEPLAKVRIREKEIETNREGRPDCRY